MVNVPSQAEAFVYIAGLISIGGICFLLKEVVSSAIRFYFSKKEDNKNVERRRQSDQDILEMKQIMERVAVATEKQSESWDKFLTDRRETVFQVQKIYNKIVGE